MKRFAIRFNAPVVLSFALISLLVLVLDSATGGASTARLFCVYRAPLTDPLTYVRFFTHVLGHSGYSHYMGNMLLLLLVGPGLEEKYGSRNLLLTIVITAFATGLVQFLLFPHSALLGAQRRGVYDDRPVLLYGDEEGRHSSDHAAGGGPVLRQRDRRRPDQNRQRVPSDPHCGRRERHRVRLPAGPGEKTLRKRPESFSFLLAKSVL